MRVLVIMPVFNGERYLAEAVESLLAQTFADFQLLIVNDGSTDSTEQITRAYAEKDSRVLVHTCDTNRRWVSLNEAITAHMDSPSWSEADYVARMDCDDVCDPVRLEREVAFLEAHPEVDAVGASVDVFNCRAESDPAAPSRVVEHPTAAGAVLWTMLFACAIAHPSSMMRRTLMERLACDGVIYSPKHTVAEDYHFWLRAMPESRLTNITDVLVRYRRHDTNISSEAGASSLAGRLNNAAVHDLVCRLLPSLTVPLEVVVAMRHPSEIRAADGAKAVTDLLTDLEAAVCALEWMSVSEQQHIREDATKRIGEIATCALGLDPTIGQQLMVAWMQRGQGVQSLFGSLMGQSGVPSLDGSAAEGVAANTDLAAGSTDDEVLGELQALLTSHAREWATGVKPDPSTIGALLEQSSAMFRHVDDKQVYDLFFKVMTEVVGSERGPKEKGEPAWGRFKSVSLPLRNILKPADHFDLKLSEASKELWDNPLYTSSI